MGNWWIMWVVVGPCSFERGERENADVRGRRNGRKDSIRKCMLKRKE